MHSSELVRRIRVRAAGWLGSLCARRVDSSADMTQLRVGSRLAQRSPDLSHVNPPPFSAAENRSSKTPSHIIRGACCSRSSFCRSSSMASDSRSNLLMRMPPLARHKIALRVPDRCSTAVTRESSFAARENLHAVPQLHVTENRTALRRDTLLFFEPRGMQELRMKSAPRRCHTSHRQTSKLPEDGKTARHVSAFAPGTSARQLPPTHSTGFQRTSFQLIYIRHNRRASSQSTPVHAFICTHKDPVDLDLVES
ncbi:hypothetical protein L1887_48010 [Cichorium endivia]|nr:hypothetical protein L1887_48010 [Cichorium endivia]